MNFLCCCRILFGLCVGVIVRSTKAAGIQAQLAYSVRASTVMYFRVRPWSANKSFRALLSWEAFNFFCPSNLCCVPQSFLERLISFFFFDEDNALQ